ncbi:sensor histidine kinase [Aquimarina sp. 2201CG1-2-11]|uniref:tetratricopeptide repeat-containing sensor histidine kinase n=1 Tax=Aquimarina discodermiae TaxID=3231043 RepID=UPI003461A292
MNTLRFFIKKIGLCYLFFTLSVGAQETTDIMLLHEQYKKYEFKNLPKATVYARQAVLFSEKTGDDDLILQSSYYLAKALYRERKIQESKEKFQECINLAKKHNDVKLLSLSYISLSKVNRRQGNYTLSLQNLKKAETIAKEYKFDEVLHRGINARAVLYTRTQDYRKSIALLRSTLKKYAHTDADHTLTDTYRILGDLYAGYLPVHNRDSSAYFYKKGIEIIEKTDNDFVKTNLYLNYGDLLIQSEKYNKAFHYLSLAEKLAQQTLAYSRLYSVSVNLGTYYFDIKNYPKSIEKFQKALQEYGAYANGDQKAHTYWLLADAYYYNKQFEKGYLQQEKLILLKDSLFTIDKNKTFEKLQTEYEVAHKNDKISLLEQEKKLATQQKIIILVVGLLLLIPSMLFLVIYRYRIKAQKTIQTQQSKLHQQEKEQLQQEQKIKRIEGYIEGEEKEKNRIALELHDGIAGQLAGIKHYGNTLLDSPEKTKLLSNLTQVTQEVRLLSHSLSTNYSTQQTLTDLLQILQEQYKNHFNIEISIYPLDNLESITDQKKHFLYRVLQELISNIYKHAKASTVTISLTIAEELTLIVEDDGIGFDIDIISKKGIGLQNIKERVDALDGELLIDTHIDNGTTVIIKIPND